jgi:mannose-6-phosphate isomerase-like protein (cupin superfamily)
MGENKPDVIQVDSWVWGNEKILWGFSPDHQYTFKVLEPKRGRAGCMSLQYHHKKSESWLVWEGVIWALMAVEGKVCTRIMRRGDLQNISPGTIHRLTGITDNAQVIEPSTPDRHAADKSVSKDVVRLHCVFGRECSAARDASEKAVVLQCEKITEEALLAIEAGKLPPEYYPEILARTGATKI